MTGFGDVNVGDKVRLTAEDDGTVHEFTVTATHSKGDRGYLNSAHHGWYYMANWSVEVLEPAPKPLPTEPGAYESPIKGGVYTLDDEGRWSLWGYYVYEQDVARDLVRLVPVSAVEEARNEVVKEIVEFVKHHTALWDTAELLERKFGGGKA